GIRRLARARAPDRGERLREGAERGEAPRRGDGDPCASAGALASHPFCGGETDDGRVARGMFYGNRTTREGRRPPVLIEPSLDDPCTALCVIDPAPKPQFHNEGGVPIVRLG